MAQKTIDEVINRVTSIVKNFDYSHLETAKTLHWAKNVVVWKYTEYKGWSGFCRAHITMSDSNIWRLVSLVNKLKNFGYTDDDCKEIIREIGWSRFILGMFDLKRKLSVTSFIKKYKTWDPSTKKPDEKEGGDRAYAFSLPVDLADKLDGYLTLYGMTVCQSRRHGVRDAFITLVENLE